MSLCLNKYQAMKKSLLLKETPRHSDILGNGGVAPRILNLGIIWRCVVFFMLRWLYAGVKPFVPIGYEAVWTLELVWTRW